MSNEVNTKQNRGPDVEITVRLVVIVGLLFVLASLVTCMVILKSHWEEKDAKISAENREAVAKELDDLWEEGDYYRFVASCEARDAGNSKDGVFESYYPLYLAAQKYEEVNGQCMALFISGTIATASEEKREIKTIGSLLADFYDMKSYYKDIKDEEIIANAKKKIPEAFDLMDGILMTYFELTDKEIETIRNDRNKKEIIEILQGGMDRAKEKKY